MRIRWFKNLKTAFVVALIALLPLSAWGKSNRARSVDSLNAIADDFFWALDKRGSRPNFSAAGNKAWLRKLAHLEKRLKYIKHSNLNDSTKLTFRMLKRQLERHRQLVENNWIARDLHGYEAPLTNAIDAASFEPQTVNDVRWVIKSLQLTTKTFRDYTKLLEQAIAEGNVPPDQTIESAAAKLEHSLKPGEGNPFTKFRQKLKANLGKHPRYKELLAEYDAAVAKHVRPATKQLRDFLLKKYLPHAQKLGSRPDRYLHFMGYHLGPNHPKATKLNRIGQDRVAELHKELTKTAKQLDPKMTTLPRFMAGLNKRKSTRFNTAEELLDHTRQEIKHAYREAGKMMTRPKSKITVRPVAPHEEKTIAAQYYPKDEHEGVYEINTTALLSSTLRYNQATLAQHEYGAHHMAAMIAYRNKDLPAFRTQNANTKYDEGLALTIEMLRDENGGFTPYERVGFLVNALWRAARLVVDTGLHTGTMTQKQAEDYFRKATFCSPATAKAEIRRYINWPGQALSYEVGKMEFVEIIDAAKKILGKNFKQKAFMDRFLRLGSVPLKEARVEMIKWANRSLGQHTSKKAKKRIPKSRRKTNKTQVAKAKAARRPPARRSQRRVRARSWHRTH